MVVRYELAGEDLAGVRFAISPVNELVLSLHAWRDPGRYPVHLPWIRALAEVRDQLDTEALLGIVNEGLWTPDFLTPRPRSPLTRLEDEFARIESTPMAVVRRDLESMGSPLLNRQGRQRQQGQRGQHGQPGQQGPQERRVLSRIVAALRAYWELCFAPHWPRMRALLEGDVTYRGREMAQRGLAAMFGGLARRVSLTGNVVSVRLSSEELNYTRPTGGELTLIPSMWTSSASVPISPLEPPMIIYLARGSGTLWEPEPLAAPPALVGLLGAHRAGLLTMLGTPASSTELAVRLGVTTTAVNQHLRALRAGGLLVSARHGRSVLYRRTDLAERLL
jgi:biotin operon repressor